MMYHKIIAQKFWRKQAFTPGNSAKLCDTLGNSKVKNQDQWKFHLELLYLEHPCQEFPGALKIPLPFLWWGNTLKLFLQSITLEIPCPTPFCYFSGMAHFGKD